MDFAKIFQSIEGAVFEVMVWILFLPRTLLRSMFKPRWAISYLNEEWKKEQEDRFDDYLSPVLLWLMVAVIPSSSLIVIVNPGQQGGGSFFQSVTDTDRLFIATLYAMIVPFSYLIWLEWINKRPVRKSSLKRSFYMHCYALAPAQFLFGASIFLGFINPGFFLLTLLSIVLLAVYEAFVFQYELKIAYGKAFWYALVPQPVIFILLVLILLIITPM